MRSRRVMIAGVALGVGLLVAAGSTRGRGRPEGPASMRIGVASSLFRDVPESMAMVLAAPLADLIAAQTGMSGKVLPAGSALEMGRKLAEGRLQLGVFQGVELAWARQKYPHLRPLVVITNQDRHFRAYLVTRAGTGVRRFADLRGKAVAVPKFSHEHIYLFVERPCREAGLDGQHFFAKLTKPDTPEDALDDVVDGVVKAAFVEGMPLHLYERRKPGRSSLLRVVKESDVFPASAIVYHDGAMNPDTVQRLRQALLNAPDTSIGRQLMTLWRVSGFVEPPAEYLASLSKILKSYPPPEVAPRTAAGPATPGNSGRP